MSSTTLETTPTTDTPPRSEAPDPAEVEAFADRLVTILNDAGLAVLTALGHRTDLFETMAGLPPATSEEIAAAANLDERYVREWLDGLTVGGMVTHDPGDDTYHLPAAHAPSLTNRGDNIAPFAQYITMMGTVENQVVEAFREGGGVPYEHFERFQEIMEEDSGGTVLGALDDILGLVDGLVERLEGGIDVLDLGCGRGRALVALAERFPASTFTGHDLDRDAIAFATEHAAERGLDNVAFEQRDLTDFDDTATEDAFDLVTTFDAVHDQRAPDRLLAGINRTLRDDGVYLMQDIHASSQVDDNVDHPLGPLLYAISVTHCMTVSLAVDGAGLGTMWGRQLAREYLHDAGFGDVTVRRLDHDVQNDYWIVRR